jgi:hypothetical protein
VPKRLPGKADARDLAHEIIRRTRRGVGNSGGDDSLPYVVRLSDPPTPHESLQLAACQILRHPIAIVPASCTAVEEWLDRYSKLARG